MVAINLMFPRTLSEKTARGRYDSLQRGARYHSDPVFRERRKQIERERDGRNSRRATCHPDRQHSSHGLCKQCYMQQFRKSYVLKPRVAANRKQGAWKKNGIEFTVKEYQQLLDLQGGACAICLRKEKLCVDHDHATGKVRGLLCDYCNRRLLIEKNTAEIFDRAAAYLRSSPPVLGKE